MDDCIALVEFACEPREIKRAIGASARERIGFFLWNFGMHARKDRAGSRRAATVFYFVASGVSRIILFFWQRKLERTDAPLLLFGAGPEYKLLHKNSLDEMCMATPAIAGDRLLIRTLTKLYCLRKGG